MFAKGRTLPIGIATVGIAVVKSGICLIVVMMMHQAGAIFCRLRGAIPRCHRPLLYGATAAKRTQYGRQ